MTLSNPDLAHAELFADLRTLKHLYINLASYDLAIRKQREFLVRLDLMIKTRESQACRAQIARLEARYIAQLQDLTRREQLLQSWLESLPICPGAAAIRLHYFCGLGWDDVADLLDKPVTNIAKTAQRTVEKYADIYAQLKKDPRP